MEWKKANTAEDRGNLPKPKGFGGYMKYEY